MKTFVLVSICSLALAGAILAQSPSAPAGTPPAASASIAPSPGVTGTPSDLADKIQRNIDKKMKQKGLHFTIGDEDADASGKSDSSHDEIPALVVPIVAVVFLSIFGAPVLIVAVIMYFGFSRNRMMHRTVRMMVEKGQPVPPELLAAPAPAVRQRSDLRRGVVLLMVGAGLMVFLGAVNDWENGAWAVGIIPLLIGAGYLLVWKLEGAQKAKTDNPPPLP